MSGTLGLQCPHCMGPLKRKGKHQSGRQRYQCYLCERKTTYPIETAEGYNLKRVSSLRDGATGEEKIRWEIRDADKAKQQELMQEAIKAMAERLPTEPPVPAPSRSNSDLTSCYILTDYHLGMLAWQDETGADWDAQIAEDLLTKWFAQAVQSAPASQTGILAQLGDFLHHDGLDSVTPEHGHILDADTRFQKIVRIAIRSLRRIIRIMLDKHENVHVIAAEGNHDPASSIWLREWLAAIYEDEPRVTVDQSADVYYCYEHGKTSLFFHHGHKRKPGQIGEVMAAKFREVFGRTKFSYAHLGHQHHVQAQETNLMVAEQHRTLAAPDAHASRLGYSAGRSAQVITYSKQHGEVGRITITPEMVA